MMKSQKLLILFALAMLWPLAAARAAVVVTALPEPLNLHDDWFGEYKPIDLDSNGSEDVTFGYSFSGTAIRTERANRIVITLDPSPNIGGPPFQMLPGSLIGLSLGEGEPLWASTDSRDGYVAPGDQGVFLGIVLVLSTGSSSSFRGRGLIGVEFESGLGTHYGYIDIEAGPGYAGITLYGWAYETEPGAPITAAFVPESSASLLALGAAGGLLARRRRCPQRSGHTRVSGSE